MLTTITYVRRQGSTTISTPASTMVYLALAFQVAVVQSQASPSNSTFPSRHVVHPRLLPSPPPAAPTLHAYEEPYYYEQEVSSPNQSFRAIARNRGGDILIRKNAVRSHAKVGGGTYGPKTFWLKGLLT